MNHYCQIRLRSYWHILIIAPLPVVSFLRVGQKTILIKIQNDFLCNQLLILVLMNSITEFHTLCTNAIKHFERRFEIVTNLPIKLRKSVPRYKMLFTYHSCGNMKLVPKQHEKNPYQDLRCGVHATKPHERMINCICIQDKIYRVTLVIRLILLPSHL